jgi:hypothetical protein
MASLLDEVRAVTEQLEPERARSCRNAFTMASVMVDEIRLRAMPARSTSPNREPGAPDLKGGKAGGTRA